MIDLKGFRKAKKLSQVALGDLLGIKQSFVSQIENGIDPMPEWIEKKLSELYPEDASLYRALKGKVLSGAVSSEVSVDDAAVTGKVIPLYDAEASAGQGGGMDMSAVSRPIAMIEIGSILKDSESALRVYGNSMVPNYPAGCILGLRPNRDSFIEPGRVYVVETMEDRYLKRLHYNKDRSALRCISDNHMIYDDGPMKGEFCYPEFEIPLDEVRRLFRVVGVIKRNVL